MQVIASEALIHSAKPGQRRDKEQTISGKGVTLHLSIDSKTGKAIWGKQRHLDKRHGLRRLEILRVFVFSLSQYGGALSR